MNPLVKPAVALFTTILMTGCHLPMIDRSNPEYIGEFQVFTPHTMERRTPDEARRSIYDFLLTDRSHIIFNPEYLQRHFFFTVPQPEVRSSELITEQAQIARTILQESDETRFTIYMSSQEGIEPVRRSYLQAVPELSRYHELGRLEFRLGAYIGCSWAQDLGGSIHRRGGGSEFLMGLNVGGQSPCIWQALRDEGFLIGSEFIVGNGTQIPITTVPIKLEGGNIAPTTINNENVVVTSSRTLRLTKEYYLSRYNYEIPDDEIIRVLEHAFSTRVLLLQNPREDRESSLAFHIDQTIFFPRDGIAVMLIPESISPETPELLELIQTLRQYRTQLQQAGFRIIGIPTTNHHASSFHVYSNAIPITRPDGSSVIIMPSFGDAAHEETITRILEEGGFDVNLIMNMTAPGMGNSHCILGALARSSLGSTSLIL